MPDCPRCQIPLVARTVTTDKEAWEVEVDVCENSCGGLWLESVDFEADDQANLLLDEELTYLNKGALAVDTSAPAECPEGHGPMHRYDWNNENIHLDACSTCGGRWVDGGEIARIQRQWGQEPIDAAQEAELMQKIGAIKRQTHENWKEESFGQWFLKRLTLSAFRKKR